MVDATFELVENIFDKILSSSQLDSEELDQLKNNVDSRLKIVEQRFVFMSYWNCRVGIHIFNIFRTPSIFFYQYQ